MVERDQAAALALRNRMLDAAEVVVVRQGIASLTLEAVAAEAGLSKGGLLHHFPNKDRLIEAMVVRAAENQRDYYKNACARTPEGAGQLARGVLNNCLTDAETWTDQLRRSSAAVFAALAHKPALIEPMRGVYSDLYKRLEQEDLPPGVGEAIAAAADGLWLNWVLGLVPVDQSRMTRVRTALERLLAPDDAEPAAPAQSTKAAKSAQSAKAETPAKTAPKKSAARSAAARQRPGGRRS